MKKQISEDCVKVVIRCRPLTNKEKDEKQKEIVKVNSKQNEIVLLNPSNINVKLKRKSQ